MTMMKEASGQDVLRCKSSSAGKDQELSESNSKTHGAWANWRNCIEFCSILLMRVCDWYH